MRAVVVAALGGPEVLEIRDIAEPQPAAGQVAIEVAYASVNYADVMARRGDYAHGSPPPFVPGLEVSGSIRAMGAGVEGFHVGQHVTAITGSGGYAEVALAPAEFTFPVTGIELAVAAAVPAVGATAVGLLSEIARVRAGESLLIHSAAGGVGSFAGQLARHLGAGLVLGTVGSQDKIAYAKSFGYDQVLLREAFVEGVRELTSGVGIDIILESVGGEVLAQSRSVLAPLGRLVVFGNSSATETERILPQELLGTNTAIMGFSFGDLRQRAPQRLAAFVQQALALVRDGAVRIDITKTFPLGRSAEAHRHLENRASTGKLLISME